MRTPAYITVYNAIKNKILDGVYKTGDFLPTENELCEMFSVSRTTVRKAVEALSHEGMLSVQQGHGTVVLDYAVFQNMNVITGFTETLKRRGKQVSLKFLNIYKEKADAKMAKKLGIEEGAEIAHVERVSCSDGVPIAFIQNWIPYNLVNGIEKRAGEISSLYKFLQNEYFISIDMTKDRISASAANNFSAELLDVEIGHPMLCDERICYMKYKPVCLDKLIINSDMYEFDINLYKKN